MRGWDVSEMEGRSVLRRPSRSPEFQKRKAMGMKQAGWRMRGVRLGGWMDGMACVKTGKTSMVIAKVRATARAR